VSDAFPMVAACATRQGVYSTDRCACGELKSVSAWMCATCAVRQEINYRDFLADAR
jgi:hypothetical protein